MTTRRAIKGVLEGFLGTYVSRYSEYDGYWLFGFLVLDLQHLRIDLLSNQACAVDNTPKTVALTLARSKFRDQVGKAGLSLKSIGAAELEITKLSGTQRVLENGQVRDGYGVLFRAVATMDNGRVYERQRTVFVSPHNASIELRSVRGAT
jgi:hypothetical protein